MPLLLTSLSHLWNVTFNFWALHTSALKLSGHLSKTKKSSTHTFGQTVIGGGLHVSAGQSASWNGPPRWSSLPSAGPCWALRGSRMLSHPKWGMSTSGTPWRRPASLLLFWQALWCGPLKSSDCHKWSPGYSFPAEVPVLVECEADFTVCHGHHKQLCFFVGQSWPAVFVPGLLCSRVWRLGCLLPWDEDHREWRHPWMLWRWGQVWAGWGCCSEISTSTTLCPVVHLP